MARAAASASLTWLRLAARLESCCAGAAVSKLPGSRLLMVTFLSATLRATPARNAVRPARAPLDRSRPAMRHLDAVRGDVDDSAEAAARHRVDDFLNELDGRHHVHGHAARASPGGPARGNSRSGGPPLLLIRMSGVGQASSSAAWPSAVETSASTGVTAMLRWCGGSLRRFARAARWLRPLITRRLPPRQAPGRSRCPGPGSRRRRWRFVRECLNPYHPPVKATCNARQ